MCQKLLKLETIPQLIANNMSGCFFPETRCILLVVMFVITCVCQLYNEEYMMMGCL